MNELAKLYPSSRIKWINENSKIYVSWNIEGSSFDYIVSDISECHRVVRQVKIDQILSSVEPLQDK